MQIFIPVKILKFINVFSSVSIHGGSRHFTLCVITWMGWAKNYDSQFYLEIICNKIKCNVNRESETYIQIYTI